MGTEHNKLNVNSLMAVLEGEERRKFIQEVVEELNRENEYYNRWSEKIHNLSFEQRKSLVDKVKAKYSSESYRSRFVNHPKGFREPSEDLYWLAYEYARRYGKDYEDGFYDFVNDCRLVDDYFVVSMVSRFDGQDSFIAIQTIVENTNEVERLKEIYNGL